MRGSFWFLNIAVALFLFGCVSAEDSMKFEADKYRAQIENIEGLLGQSEKQPDDGQRLHKYSADLASAMARDMQNHMQKEYVLNRIISFGEGFAQLEQQGIDWDLEQARDEWKTMRANLFVDASWFQPM
ncbi:MAG TPA: hypothetical protein VEK15_02600 [Vicinamibacteria bacterium]|nr:hypothetical protein [Vicinamibacteria bacterium]